MTLLKEALTVSCDLAMFDFHYSSASGDVTYLICYVTLQELVLRIIRRYGLELFKVNQPLAKFGGYERSGNRDIMALAWHVVSEDNMIKGSCHFMVRNSLR